MPILRRIAMGAAGLVAAYAMKKLAKSMQKQLEAAQKAAEEQHHANTNQNEMKDIKTLRLDPKTGVYTTDES